MSELQAIQHPLWEIALPPGWLQQGETAEGEMYFESEDGTKGLYIATWRMGEGDEERSAAQVARSFRTSTVASLQAMAGYEWELVSDESNLVGTTTIGFTDAWARDHQYRIMCKVLAQLPLVVRAAFHDYLCDDLAASQAYFAPILESLRPAGPPN